MTDQVDVSGGAARPGSEPARGEAPRQFGLTTAMALIVGSVIGVGIFNLPTSLSVYGPGAALPLSSPSLARGDAPRPGAREACRHG